MMGTIYYAICHDCKRVRDLDKFYSMYKVSNRKEALELGELIKEQGWYSSALLVSFMWEHKGHNCTVGTEHDSIFDCEDDGEYEEDQRFWW